MTVQFTSGVPEEGATAGSHAGEAQIRDFYNAFPYPWKAWVAERPIDPDLYRIHLCQDVGDWSHRRIPASPSIWVAGCGTNQAVLTALRFPTAQTLGSDLSDTALRLESEQATALDVKLEFEKVNINDASYVEEFDYVLCTGVVHHNPDPRLTLRKLCSALRPGGILELMVYNQFHRVATSALQEALRLLVGTAAQRDWAVEAMLAKRLLHHFPVDNLLTRTLAPYRFGQEEEFIDATINPLERSFTVSSLAALAEAAGLQLILPCPNSFDLQDERYLWHLDFGDIDLQSCFDRLSDLERWQVVNLLRFDMAPMLWFYLERRDCNRRRTQEEVNNGFLATRFTRSDASAMRFVRDLTDERYTKLPDPVPLPSGQGDAEVRRVTAEADGAKEMRDLLLSLGFELKPALVNKLRIQLTSSLFPRLRAVAEP